MKAYFHITRVYACAWCKYIEYAFMLSPCEENPMFMGLKG